MSILDGHIQSERRIPWARPYDLKQGGLDPRHHPLRNIDQGGTVEVQRHFVLDPPPHRCDAAAAGGLIYLAGMTAYERTAPLEQQAQETMQKIDIALAAAGSDKSQLVWANVWLADTTDYDAFNVVWNQWIVPGKGPARACVGATLCIPGLKVEIAVVAAPL